MDSDSPTSLAIPGHLELHVGTRSGRVSIKGEDRDDMHIESDAPIREEKIRVDSTGRVSLKSSRGGSGWLKIRCPVGADLKIDWAQETLRHLHHIWTRPVHIQTIVENEARRISYDGETHEISEV